MKKEFSPINTPVELSMYPFADMKEMKRLGYESLTMPCRQCEYDIVRSAIRSLGQKPFRLVLVRFYNGRRAPSGTVEVWTRLKR